MKLVVISHKPCWISRASPSGYATDGGFPMQMAAISELFDETTVVVPVHKTNADAKTKPLVGHNLNVVPLSMLAGDGIWRRVRFLSWLMRNTPTIFQQIWNANAAHTPIPGDVGTIGMLIAFMLRKPLFVRHCGNWAVQTTVAERFWRWFMERFAGGKNVFMATGDSRDAPSRKNVNIRWIFSTSLREKDVSELNMSASKQPQSPPHLIIVCRQEPLKGTDVVIQSLPQIAASYPGVHLDVLGSGSALPHSKMLAQEIGVTELVTFYGHVKHDRVLKLLENADVFCFPTSSSEGFPKVVLEALACGLPVVTTHVSTLPHLINQGVGTLLDDAEPALLASAVMAILANPSEYAAMSQRAKNLARNYTLETWQKTIGERLRQVWGRLQSNE